MIDISRKMILLCSVSVLLTLPSSSFADVAYTPAVRQDAKSFTVSKIRIYNKINEGDAKQFHALVAAAKQRGNSLGISLGDNAPILVLLDSTGGSVNDAISIGKEIRSLNPMSVNVLEDSICISACVFILAGAPSRLVQGRVGIHRPHYVFDDALTPEAQKQQYAAMEKRIKQYLESVNVPSALYDTMFRIPPEKMRYLTFREMQDFNLNEDDPYYKESRDAWFAKRLGLSKSEYTSQMAACNRLPTDNATKHCLDDLLATGQRQAVAPPTRPGFTPIK